MKNIFLTTLLIGIACMFMACPYTSTVSIDNPNSVKLDEKLLGKWQQRNSTTSTYIVTKKDDYTYDIVVKEKDAAKGEEPRKYCAFFSDVNGTRFLNAYENGKDASPSMLLYKIVVSTETEGFTLYPFSEYITDTFSTSADLKKFVQTNMGLSFFYGTQEEYIKVGK